jgi:hypothetical protein
VSVLKRRAFMGRGPSAAVVAVVLAVVALSGLGAGVLTRSALGAFASPTATATTQPTATATLALSPSPSPTATNTPILGGSSFAITASANPNPVRSGSPFTILVSAYDSATKAPVEGIVCTLGAPSGTTNPLFASWPGPQVTDATGQARWQLVAPPAQPGRYKVEIDAQRADGSSFVWTSTVTLDA